jgi:hypothetical protein
MQGRNKERKRGGEEEGQKKKEKEGGVIGEARQKKGLRRMRFLLTPSFNANSFLLKR